MALIDAEIAEAAKKSAAASAAIAEVEVAASAPLAPAPAQMVPPGVELPAEVVQLVSVDWQGPIEPLLQSLADVAGYRLVVSGVRQPAPPTVSITRKEAPLWTVVRDAGTLVVDRGTVVLNPQRGTIELRYESRG
ncbi:DotD/TraH family lipoprotein [Amorphus sp. 3PC139-8]|uniref:DotD/TraH family lipoprotein n=1 Tax=Amorphus sp. 3PC139-8 TaxID=2735676 RepID=UPI00345C650D